MPAAPRPCTPPPELPLDRLRVAAKIDFVTVASWSGQEEDDGLKGAGIWHAPDKRSRRKCLLTVHDATRSQVVTVIKNLRDPIVMKLEIAVDFIPQAVISAEERRQLLDLTYLAVAARFRPEDKALYAYGRRGAVSGSGMPVEPLERKRPCPGQEVIYGDRGEFMQAKLYLKTMDQHADLPEDQHVVRMEVTLRRNACMSTDIGLDTLSRLIGFNYRATFTKHFRIIKEPRVRQTRGLTAAERLKRERAMTRAWCLAGVAKFAIPLELPADTAISSKKHIERRRRAQLAYDEYKLMRDQDANAKIGAALMGLQRRMRASR